MNNTSVKSAIMASLFLLGGNAIAADSLSRTDAPAQMESSSKQQMITVADKKSLNAMLADSRSSAMFRPGAFSVLSDKQMVITKKNASFIKVHFAQFNIPDGSYVLVRSPDGSQSYRYSNTEAKKMTLDESINDDGVNRFSALSIVGDTAIVEFVAEKSVNERYQVHVDFAMQGYSEQEIQRLLWNQTSSDPTGRLSTCGVNERRDVQCWADSHPVEYERTRPTARILMNGSGLCTAWRVGEDNHMFTNNHCVGSQSTLSGTEVWFNYQRTGCGSGTTNDTTIVTGDQLLKTDYTLDYTLFSINDFPAVESFGYYGLDVRNALQDERIYISQHGSGNPKELSIESDQNAGGVCRVDSPLAFGRGADTDIGYMCDTIGGSSGSPVLAASSNKVIALHHFGGCENQGVRIDLIWPQVANFFGGVIPDGDNEVPPNGDPRAAFGYTTNELEVTFTDHSNDSNGTIESHAWDFGDGNTSSDANPIHTYDEAGSYEVTLTVTDNDDITDSITRTVTVAEIVDPQMVIKNISGTSRGENDIFRINVPAGMTKLTFKTFADNGDADLYVRKSFQPTTSQYDCRDISLDSNETCVINNPEPGGYWVIVRTWNAYDDLTLTGTYE
ncbi:PKD domain-containing protein [Pleionea sp. CnH1-48]|uniref:PKD domain-containing protein n=1 Tax=Pleionea sp. CnH1-48 TaxID=2954494 RepID=UPI002097285E|nr:PKD domain-containing protein [Pleionea sp. CnH1-48]MCO7225115.1 PKD domain-containing protein [Pleionea sp. CnH1-48]